MEPRDIGNYGGPKLDALPVSNPETQIAANEWNRQAEDTAQLTRTGHRAVVNWITDNAAFPLTIPIANINHRSVWGSGDAQKPVIEKVGVGLYRITYAASFADALGIVESVSFFDGHVSIRSSNPADDVKGAVLTIASNVVTVATYSPVSVLADIGTTSTAVFVATAWLL